jgi:hypothetical protein
MAQTPQQRRIKDSWHAVGILPRGKACEHALALAGTRFLSKDAPPLPLPDCPNGGSCTCVYQHFADRRQGPRRAAEMEDGMRGSRPNTERRIGRGRRKQDAE